MCFYLYIVTLFASFLAAVSAIDAPFQYTGSGAGAGQWYEFISASESSSGKFTWLQARDAAASKRVVIGGKTHLGQLVVVGSTALNTFLHSLLPSGGNGKRAWLGAVNQANTQAWSWVQGREFQQDPLYGQAFWQGNASGSSVGGNYNSWPFQNNQPGSTGSAANQYAFMLRGGGGWFSTSNNPTFGSGSIGYFVQYTAAPIPLPASAFMLLGGLAASTRLRVSRKKS